LIKKVGQFGRPEHGSRWLTRHLAIDEKKSGGLLMGVLELEADRRQANHSGVSSPAVLQWVKKVGDAAMDVRCPEIRSFLSPVKM
jgi:hypothetical protein